MTTQEFRAEYAAHVTGQKTDVAEANVNHLQRVMSLIPRHYLYGLRGLEVGCFKGGTTLWLLKHGIKWMTVIDTFEGSPEHAGVLGTSTIESEFRDAISEHSKYVAVNKGHSDERLAYLMNMGVTFDLAYIDASHDSRDVIVDITLAFRMLEPGGIMFMDDYGWLMYDEPYRNPKPAIDFFLACYADELRVIEKGYAVSIQKL